MLSCIVPLSGPRAGQRPLLHLVVLTLGARSCLDTDEGEGNRSARTRQRNRGGGVEKVPRGGATVPDTTEKSEETIEEKLLDVLKIQGWDESQIPRGQGSRAWCGHETVDTPSSTRAKQLLDT